MKKFKIYTGLSTPCEINVENIYQMKRKKKPAK